MTNPTAQSPKQQLRVIYQLIRQNNHQEARQLLQQYFKANAPDPDAYYIGTFLTNDIHRKIQLCERALQINPKHGPALQLLEKLQTELHTKAELVNRSNFTEAPLPATSAPFSDPWGEEQARKSAVSNRTQSKNMLVIVLTLVIVLLVMATVAVLVTSRTTAQPTPPAVAIINTSAAATETVILPTNPPIDTATLVPPTRTRKPTFTLIPTRTLMFGTKQIAPTATSGATSTPEELTPQLTSTLPFPAEAVNSPLNVLSYHIEDAEYSISLDKIIMVISDPNALMIYDPEKNSGLTIDLDRKPTCISVSQDGKFAAVGQDGLVTFVNLETSTIIKTLDLTITAADIVLLNTGWIVVTSPNHDGVALDLLQIATNTEFIPENVSLSWDGFYQRAPDGVSVYRGRRDALSGGIYRLYFDASKVTEQRYWLHEGYSDDYRHCGGFWVVADTNQIFSRCGRVFRSEADPKLDMSYVESLADITSINGVVHAASQGKLVALGKTLREIDRLNVEAGDPLMIFTYNDHTLARESVKILPAFRDGQHGDSGYLFLNNAGTRYYALLGRNARIYDSVYVYDGLPKPNDIAFGIVTGWVDGSDVATMPTEVKTEGVSSTATPTRDNAEATPNGASVVGKVQRLDYQVVQAEYSKALNRIIMISDKLDALQVYDPVNGKDTLIPLPSVPSALSVSTDGNFAAVGYDGFVAYIELKNGKVVKTFELTSDVPIMSIRSITLASNGWLYVEGDRRAFAIEIATGRQGRPASSGMVVHPNGYAYWIRNGMLMRIDLTDPDNPVYLEGPTDGEICGNLWLSEDGRRLFTGCGGVLRSSADLAVDRTFDGSLSRLGGVTALADSEVSRKVLAIGSSTQINKLGDNKVVVYNYDTLSTDQIIELPSISPNIPNAAMHGQYVFFDSDGVNFYVIMRMSDGPNANGFRVAHMRLTEPDASTVNNTATPQPAVLNGQANVSALDFTVNRAEYSKALKRIIMLSEEPPALHIYDPVSSTDKIVTLSPAPISLSVSPDGNFAAVGHQALVSYVDLNTAQVVKTFEISFTANNVVLTGDGWLHASSTDNRRVGIELTTGKQGDGFGGISKVHPNGRVYSLYSNNIIYGFGISEQEGQFQCGNFWFSEDGRRVFTGCSSVLRGSSDLKLDLTYNGRLAQLDHINALVQAGGKVLAIGTSHNPETRELETSDTNLLIYDYDTLRMEKTITLPSMNANGVIIALHGRYIFFDPDGINYYVIGQADSSAGLLNGFGIAHMQLSEDSSAAPNTTAPTAVPNADLDILNFTISQAIYSKPLDRIIMTMANPNQIVIYNPVDRSRVLIPLDRAPTSLDLAPDGLYGVVGHDGLVSLFDLKAAKVLKTYPLKVYAIDAALALNGFIYVLPKPTRSYAPIVDMYTVNVKTSAVQAFQHLGIYLEDTGKISLFPDGQHLYYTDAEGNTQMFRINIANDGTPSNGIDWDRSDDHQTCDSVWVSDNSNRLYTTCGKVYTASVDLKQDMTYIGMLAQPLYPNRRLYYRWMTDSKAKVILGLIDAKLTFYDMQDPPQQLLMFDSDSYQFIAPVDLPTFATGDKPIRADGRYVFVNSAGDHMYVIVQAEYGSGLLNDFGIWSRPLVN